MQTSYPQFLRQLCIMAVLALPLTACNEEWQCTMLAVYGVHISVVDSLTGEGIAEGARGYVQDNAFSDTLEWRAITHADGPLRGAMERPGTYTVVVNKPGYQQWRKDGVRVVMTKDDCHVKTVKLTAKMVH